MKRILYLCVALLALAGCKKTKTPSVHPDCQEEDPAFDAWCDRVIAALEQAKASLR